MKFISNMRAYWVEFWNYFGKNIRNVRSWATIINIVLKRILRGNYECFNLFIILRSLLFRFVAWTCSHIYNKLTPVFNNLMLIKHLIIGSTTQLKVRFLVTVISFKKTTQRICELIYSLSTLISKGIFQLLMCVKLPVLFYKQLKLSLVVRIRTTYLNVFGPSIVYRTSKKGPKSSNLFSIESFGTNNLQKGSLKFWFRNYKKVLRYVRRRRRRSVVRVMLKNGVDIRLPNPEIYDAVIYLQSIKIRSLKLAVPRTLFTDIHFYIASTYKLLILHYRLHLKGIWGTTSTYNLHSLQTLLVVLVIDACLTDDEPLMEPVEWSMFQSWLLFIFMFAWIAENLITSRYGRYVGRDKRVWLGWFKSFWLIELFYAVNYGVASVFVIVPFYNEVTYSLFFIVSWWNWYTRTFFFKFIFIFTLMSLIGYYLQINARRSSWRKNVVLVFIVNLILGYLVYTQFIILLFGYFTTSGWYSSSRAVNYVQLSHEPLKWSWGPSKRDHFSYHQSRNVFWFKNDTLFAGSFLMFHMFFIISLFLLYIYWIVLLRRIVSTHEIPLTYLTYCVASLKQFLYLFLLFYLMVFLSYIICYCRTPMEYSFTYEVLKWVRQVYLLFIDYPNFISHLVGMI